ncbi:hypothetical protein SELMODRAFT_416689 [Selaginella moellendorffii]|uniref:Uncharacterized protein n=1 Tax=Selaginella moellendorffii TaxID=88036 RepID=D8S038_SELML|nr:hypothetical protein SELMODRAFT_416689 [Selaginella moellendorffii]
MVVYENDIITSTDLSSLAVNPEQPVLLRASLIDDNTPLISSFLVRAFPPHYSNDVIQAYFSHIIATASKRRRLFTVAQADAGQGSGGVCGSSGLLQEDWEGVEEELPRPWPPGEWEREARCRHSQQARLRCLHWVGGEQGATQGDLGENCFFHPTDRGSNSPVTVWFPPSPAATVKLQMLSRIFMLTLVSAAVSITVVLFLIPLPFLETGIQSSVFFGLSEINSISWYIFGREHNNRVVEVVNLLGFITGVFYASYAWKATWKPLFWPPQPRCLLPLLFEPVGAGWCHSKTMSLACNVAWAWFATLDNNKAVLMSTMFAAGCAAILTCLMLV